MSKQDATTRLERIEKSGTEKYLKLVDMGADLVVNRPIGSQNLSKAEQKKRYQENKFRIKYEADLLQQYGLEGLDVEDKLRLQWHINIIHEFLQTRGFPKGLVHYVEYVEEMMKDA